MRVGKWVNVGFKILGAVVGAGPAIKGVTDHVGDPANIGPSVLYNYTGIQQDGNINFQQTTVGIGAIVGAVILSKIGGFLGRRF